KWLSLRHQLQPRRRTDRVLPARAFAGGQADAGTDVLRRRSGMKTPACAGVCEHIVSLSSAAAVVARVAAPRSPAAGSTTGHNPTVPSRPRTGRPKAPRDPKDHRDAVRTTVGSATGK